MSIVIWTHIIIFLKIHIVTFNLKKRNVNMHQRWKRPIASGKSQLRVGGQEVRWEESFFSQNALFYCLI